MSELTEYKNKSPFVLDDRPLQQILEQWRGYAALIPYEGNKTWADVLFTEKGCTPKALAEFYAAVRQADGNMLAHQAFMLAFFRMLETPRELFNALPAAHRNLYYRELLGVSERPAQPDRAVVGFTLDERTRELMLPAGLLLEAGQDAAGAALRYRLETLLLANRGKLTDIRWCAYAASAQEGDEEDEEGAVPAHVCVALDQTAGVQWPEGGMRLFESNARSVDLRQGWAVSSAAWEVEKEGRWLLKFNDFPEGSAGARITTAEGWRTLLPAGEPGEFQLGDAVPAKPSNLDSYQDGYPVVEVWLPQVKGGSFPQPGAVQMQCSQLTQVLLSTDDGIADVGASTYPFGYEGKAGRSFYLSSRSWMGATGLGLALRPDWNDVPAAALKAKVSLVVNGVSTPIGAADGHPINVAINLALGSQLREVTWNEDVHDPREQDFYLKFELASHTEQAPVLQWSRLEIGCIKGDASPVCYPLSTFGHEGAGVEAGPQVDRPQLYLGFTDIEPGQDINLHWQLRGPVPQAVQWEYLNVDNQWASLSTTVRDQTEGLFRSGLWQATLPRDACDFSTLMPAGRHWIRALAQSAQEQDYEGPAAPRLEALHVNAAIAVLDKPEEIDASHFAVALPAHSIARVQDAPAGLASVFQPYASFDGRRPETEEDFLARMAKRLRHRNRAVTWRDIEELLRERFPEIGQIRLPDREAEMTASPQQTGAVRSILVVPAAGQADNDDVLRPLFSPARLAQMRDYITGLASAWLRLELRNPTYREVAVRWEILFEPGYNTDYGYRQAQLAAESYYVPWLHDLPGAPELGRDIDYYRLVALVQQQPGVINLVRMDIDTKLESALAAPGEILIPRFSIWPAAAVKPGRSQRSTKKTVAANKEPT